MGIMLGRIQGLAQRLLIKSMLLREGSVMAHTGQTTPNNAHAEGLIKTGFRVPFP